MNIPNYDREKKTTKFKQLKRYMPDECFRMLICGASGTGKTNTLLHMLLNPLIYYDKIYLYAKNLEQDKYNQLSEKLSQIADKCNASLDDILFSLNDEIIPVDQMENLAQKVIIFDDYVCENNQKDIINYFISGRHKNCCVIYLSQSYYKTPRDIRLNCSHYIFFETPSKREDNLICSEQKIPSDKYDAALKKKYDFIYLDKPKKIIKRNFYGDI